MLEEGACSGLTVGGTELGFFGMLSRKVQTAWELTDQVFVFEIDLDGLLRALSERLPAGKIMGE